MKKQKNKSATQFVKVKLGTVKDFFSTVKEVMKKIDRSETIEQRCATLTFVDTDEMLHFLSEEKIKLIKRI